MIGHSKLQAHMHTPGGTAQPTHSGTIEGSVLPNSNWKRWQTLYFSDCIPHVHRRNAFTRYYRSINYRVYGHGPFQIVMDELENK